MARSNEDARSQRAFTPSDLGSDPPVHLTEQEALCREREDPRRMHTAYVNGLVDLVEREGSMLGEDSSRPIDSGRHSRYDRGVTQSKEMDMEATIEAPAKSAKAQTKSKAKAPKKRGSSPYRAKAKKINAKAKAKRSTKITKEQTCVNLPLALKRAVAAYARRKDLSSSKVMRAGIARYVGYKLKDAS